METNGILNVMFDSLKKIECGHDMSGPGHLTGSTTLSVISGEQTAVCHVGLFLND